MSRRVLLLAAVGVVLAILGMTHGPAVQSETSEKPLGPRIRTWQQVNAMSYPDRDELTERLAAVVNAVQPFVRTTFADIYTGALLDLEYERAIIYVTDLTRGTELLARADIDENLVVLRRARFPRTALYEAIRRMRSAQSVFGTPIESMFGTLDGLVVRVADVNAGQRGRHARGSMTDGQSIEEFVGVPIVVEPATSKPPPSWWEPEDAGYGMAIAAVNESGLWVTDPASPPADAVTATAEFDLSRYDAPLSCGVMVDLESAPAVPFELPVRLSIETLEPVGADVRLDVRFESGRPISLSTFTTGWRVLVIRNGVLVGASPALSSAGDTPTTWGMDLVGMTGNVEPGRPWQVSMFLRTMRLCDGASWAGIAANPLGYEVIVQAPGVSETTSAVPSPTIVTARVVLDRVLELSQRAG